MRRIPGMYKFNLSYGDRTLEYQYFLTVSYKPEIVSFQRIPEFVSVSLLCSLIELCYFIYNKFVFIQLVSSANCAIVYHFPIVSIIMGDISS